MEDNPEMSFREAHNNALSTTLDDKFGEGAFAAATQLSGGETFGPKFNAAMGALGKTQTNLSNSGVAPLDIKNTMSGIINKASSETEKNGGSFATNLQAASNEVKGGTTASIEKNSSFEDNPLPEIDSGADSSPKILETDKDQKETLR